MSNLVETPPNGNRLNLGRYGNTPEASRSALLDLVVTTEDATSVMPTGAVLNGQLITNNVSPTRFLFYYGTTDGGTNTAAWDTNILVSANASPGSLPQAVSGLLPDTKYYFRAYATNASGDAFGDISLCFHTGTILVEPVRDGSESGPTNGVFRIVRPIGMAGTDLDVGLSISGTATEGADVDPINRTVFMPAGITAVTQSIRVIDDIVVEPLEAVIVSLVPANYFVSAPAVVSIADDDGLATPPMVDNAAGASGVTVASATLNGNLTAGTSAAVQFYWGESDGGTNRAAWDFVTPAQVVGPGGVSDAVTLLGGGMYFYRAYASNSAGVAFAPTSAMFSVGIRYVD
ncbi:MAG: hypothetical protein AAF492_29060, partial [Verrucomicrobiota bacterium]